jgi:hypothetical protein
MKRSTRRLPRIPWKATEYVGGGAIVSITPPRSQNAGPAIDRGSALAFIPAMS